MFNTGNTPNANDLKAYYRNFYYQNKFLVILMAISLVLLLVAQAGFFNTIYYVYLIYFGGLILKQYLGEQRVLTTYLISGMLGMLIHIIGFPEMAFSMTLISSFIGAGAVGLLVAAATYVPNLEIMLVFMGKVKIKWVAMILIGLDILSMFNVAGMMNVSHLGGVIYGFMSIYLLGNSGLKINNLFGFLFKKRGPYYKQSSTKNENVRKESDAAYNARKKAEQDEIDAILDKVKHKGYESLSAHEKQKLFDRSNNG